MTIRRLLMLSSLASLAAILLLSGLTWIGFGDAARATEEENHRALPALIAIKEARFNIVQVQQYLTDVSATADEDGFKAADASRQGALQAFETIARLEPTLAGDIATIRNSLERFHSLGVKMARLYVSDGREAGNVLMKQPGDGFDAVALILTGQLEGMEKTLSAKMSSAAQGAEAQIAGARLQALLISLVVVTLITGSGFLLYKNIHKLLGCEPHEAVAIARDIAAGDLSRNLVTSGNEKSLIAALGVMQDGLRTIIQQIHATTVELSRAAGQLSDSAGQVAGATHQQSASTSSMAASVEEMSVSITLIADNAANTQKFSQEANVSAGKGMTVVQTAIDEMVSVSEAVNRTAESIQSLGEQSEHIASIMQVIREIADQTNLLALNAAIEAARAGEQGRGFAVVADEVRKLAERTAQATREIETTVTGVRDGTQAAARDVTSGSKRVSEGVGLVKDAGDAMHQIRDHLQGVHFSADEIATALREQSAANQEVARNVESVSQMTEETSAIMQQVAELATRVNGLAETMDGSVRRFRLA